SPSCPFWRVGRAGGTSVRHIVLFLREPKRRQCFARKTLQKCPGDEAQTRNIPAHHSSEPDGVEICSCFRLPGRRISWFLLSGCHLFDFMSFFSVRQEPDIGDALAGGVAQLVRLLDWSRIHLHIEATCAQHSGRLDSLIALPGIRENNEDVRRAFRSYLDSLLSY